MNRCGDIINNRDIIESMYRDEICKDASWECSICCISLQDENLGYKLKKCNHYFHKECISKWFKQHNTCPICRTNQSI